jgi:UDP-N-acetylmuramate dehydrogenase
MKNPFEAIAGCHIRENEPLSRHTSFRIGGPARYFVIVQSLRALIRVSKVSRTLHLPVFVLGAGTNVLCQDEGYQGVVVKLKGYFSRVTSHGNLFTCGAGAKLDKILANACAQGYGGGDFLAGIPGTVGGAIYCNAGAFGRAIGDITDRVKVLTSKQKARDLLAHQIEFEYRCSGLPKNTIILAVVLKFKESNRQTILRRLRDKKEYRKEHQPRGFSAGSFFKNPRPYAAGKIIDDCGMKGLCIGQAMVSTKHANWIINKGEATAQEVVMLASLIKKRVRERTGIVLKEEVRRLK